MKVSRKTWFHWRTTSVRPVLASCWFVRILPFGGPTVVPDGRGRGCRFVLSAGVTTRWGVPCQVSLETPMACGVGACFSCVARVATADGGWDYKRVCVDGPAFDAKQLVWG